jgi:uncharacterized protein (TIGR00369 family)
MASNKNAASEQGAPRLKAEDQLQRLRHELQRPPYHAMLGLQALAVDAQTGTVIIGLAYRPEFRRGPDDRAYHGGVIAALIDIAGHAAIAVQVGRMVPTIDLRIDYLRTARGTDLRAHGKVLRLGRSIGRADIEIRDTDDVVIAVGRGTYSTQ